MVCAPRYVSARVYQHTCICLLSRKDVPTHLHIATSWQAMFLHISDSFSIDVFYMTVRDVPTHPLEASVYHSR